MGNAHREKESQTLERLKRLLDQHSKTFTVEETANTMLITFAPASEEEAGDGDED